jgi:hypothetical protein
MPRLRLQLQAVCKMQHWAHSVPWLQLLFTPSLERHGSGWVGVCTALATTILALRRWQRLGLHSASNQAT